MGITWGGFYYFDKTTMMGSCSAPYVCQRVTSFIRHIMKNLEYFLANYVDDFMGLETKEHALSAFITLGKPDKRFRGTGGGGQGSPTYRDFGVPGSTF